MMKLRALNFNLASSLALIMAIALTLVIVGVEHLSSNLQAAGSDKKAVKAPKLVANEAHRLVATYYSVSGNLQATLMLSNQGPGSIPVQISLFNKSGARNDLPPITLTGHEVRAINLRQHVQPGSVFEEGSVQVEYQGKFLELGGLVNLVDSEQSLSFEEELTEPAKAFSSARLEGVYWLPNNNTEIALAVSNTGNSRLTVNISATGEGQSGSSAVIALAPRETRVLNGEGGQGLRFRGTAGGISINHSGSPGDLVAFGHISEAAKGFSNVIDFVDPQKSKSSRLDGTGLRFGSVAGQSLAQAAVVRNIGSASVTVTGRMPYTTADGNQRVTNLPTLQLAPGEVKKLNLNIPNSVEVATAGLEFISSGQPGSIIAAALSHSANRNQVFRVPMRDATTQASSTGHYPWSIDESSATVVYIKNVTDAERDFTLHVGYEGGYYTLGVTTIPAGQTKLFDLRQLRDSQQPDSNGTVIPLNVQRGQVHWSVRGPETRTLIGRAEQANLTTGISMTSACGVCCPDSFQFAWLTPGTVTGFPGSATQFLAFRQDRDCYQFIWQYEWADPFGWSCDNTSVATVNTSGLATAGGVGSTYIRNTYYASQYYENVEDCIEVPVSANAAASCDVQCAYPVNFRQTSVADIGGGVLRFTYAWDSSTGSLSNLSSCTVGEIVTYPSGNDPYNWSSPPYASGSSSPNPTVINLPAQDGGFTDNHSPKPFQSPYTLSEVDATQYYRYRCSCSNNGDYVNVMGPITIKRKVQLVPFTNWRYTITKSGSSAVLTPLP